MPGNDLPVLTDHPSQDALRGAGRAATMLLPFAIALLVGGWFAWTVVSNHRDESSAYERAEAALAAGNYDEAVDAFAAAGSYRDAAQRRTTTLQLLAPVKSAYLDAVNALEAGDYDVAIALLEPIQETMPAFEDVGLLLEEATTGRRRALERDVDLAVAHRDWMLADDALVALSTLYPEESGYQDELLHIRENHAPIVFSRDGKLYQIGPDERDEKLLFDDFPIASPQWSPNRKFITFFAGNASRSAVTSLYLFEYATGAVEVISDWASPDPLIAWDASGLRLAFVVNTATSDMKPSDRTRLALFDLSSRTLDLVALPQADESGDPLLTGLTSPTWSPGGDRLAYVATWKPASVAGDHPVSYTDIHVTDLSSGETINLTNRALPKVSYVTWSPTSDDLLAWESRGGTVWLNTVETSIWLIDASSADRQRLTERTETTDWPTWAPDGLSYAVIAGQNTLIVRTLSGDEVVRAESEWDLDGQVSWSPQGTRVLAVADEPQGPSMTVDIRSGSESLEPLLIDFDGHWPNIGPRWSARD